MIPVIHCLHLYDKFLYFTPIIKTIFPGVMALGVIGAIDEGSFTNACFCSTLHTKDFKTSFLGFPWFEIILAYSLKAASVVELDSSVGFSIG